MKPLSRERNQHSTMLRKTLLLASLCASSQAYVQFSGAQSLDQYPWADPTPRNLEMLDSSVPSPVHSISTIPTMTTIPVPSETDASRPFHDQLLRWIKRQGIPVANPGAPQPTAIVQVSPVTVLDLISKGNPIQVPYTQTFPAVPEQWPSPSAGTVGMGTIQGEIGVVRTKSKRDESQTAMVSIQTAAPERGQLPSDYKIHEESDQPVEDRPLPTRRKLIQRGP